MRFHNFTKREGGRMVASTLCTRCLVPKEQIESGFVAEACPSPPAVLCPQDDCQGKMSCISAAGTLRPKEDHVDFLERWRCGVCHSEFQRDYAWRPVDNPTAAA